MSYRNNKNKQMLHKLEVLMILCIMGLLAFASLLFNSTSRSSFTLNSSTNVKTNRSNQNHDSEVETELKKKEESDGYIFDDKLGFWKKQVGLYNSDYYIHTKGSFYKSKYGLSTMNSSNKYDRYSYYRDGNIMYSAKSGHKKCGNCGAENYFERITCRYCGKDLR